MGKILLLFSILFVTLRLSAQDSVLENAKFKIIKNAVWFYSHVPPHVKPGAPDCSDASDIEELLKCADNMDGVKVRVEKWYKTEIITIKDLQTLTNDIDAEITTDKPERKKVLEYEVFLRNAAQIVQNAHAKLTSEEVIPDTLVQKDSKELDPDKKNNKEQTDSNQSTGKSGNRSLVILALVFGIGSLVYTYFSSKTLRRDFEKLRQNILSGSNERKRQFDDRIEQLERQLKSHESNMTDVNANFQKKFENLSKENQNYGQSKASTPQQNVVPAKQTKYAKWADEGDAFSQNSLADEQDNEKIFEITIHSPFSAKYKVSNDRQAQLFALTNYERYMGKTCKFDTVPTATSTIINVEEGDLKLQGNRWQIVTPVKIRFE